MNKPIDLLKVAELDHTDYANLWRGTDLINAGVKEPQFPPDLHARCWRIMRSCGVANIGSFDTMRMVAMRLQYNRVGIERLRAFGS